MTSRQNKIPQQEKARECLQKMKELYPATFKAHELDEVYDYILVSCRVDAAFANHADLEILDTTLTDGLEDE